MKAGILVANNGATFDWDNTDQSGKKYFSFNETAYIEALQGNDYTNKIMYSDCGDDRAWGTSNDFNPIHDAILFNISYFINKYPETKEQFFDWVINLRNNETK